MSTATYIESEKTPFENAKDLVQNWYSTCKHMPEDEMIEKMALMISTIFRDKIIAEEHDVFLSVIKVGEKDVEFKMKGGAALLQVIAIGLEQPPFHELIMKAMLLKGLTGFVRNGEL